MLVSVGSGFIFGGEDEVDGLGKEPEGRDNGVNLLGGLPPVVMRGTVVTRRGCEEEGVLVETAGLTARDSLYCRSNFDVQVFHSARLVGITGSA